MKINKTQSYPVAAAQLAECLMDREFVEARYAISSNPDVQFDAFERTGNHFLMRVIRKFELKAGKNMPGFAKKFADKDYDMMMEFRWYECEAEPYRCHYHFTVDGVPVKIEGEMELVSDGEKSCHQKLDIEVTCSLPLIGKKIAALLGEKVESGLESDFRSTMKVLENKGLLA